MFRKTNSNLIINYYVTFNCNLCCDYCIVYNNSKFSSLNQGVLDQFFEEFYLFNVKNHIFNEIYIEFFGGEPLLKYDYINKFIDNFKDKYLFKITTNGLIFNSIVEKIYENMENIIVSIHKYNIDQLLLNLSFFKAFKEKIYFTLVIDKNSFDKYYFFINKLYKHGFQNVNILPVFLKYNWEEEYLKKLFNFSKFIKGFNFFHVNYLYFNPDKVDKEFSIDFVGNIYGFNGEIIYNEKLKEVFYIGNARFIDLNELYKAINYYYEFNLKLNLKRNASLICSAIKKKNNSGDFKQDVSNYIKLNKFLKFLEVYFQEK